MPGRLSSLPLHRRELLKGGLGLVSGAVIGGLSKDGDALTAEGPEPEPAPAPEAQPEPEVETEPEPESEGEAEAEAEPEPASYRRGDRGEGVRALQEQLSANGYWLGTPDGGYGHLTEQAVFAVQKAHGLTRDGIAGPMVQQALATGHRPQPVAGGNHIEVHVPTQLLLVVRGGSTVITLNTATGNGEPYEFQGRSYTARTPTGDYQVWLVDGSGWRDGELGEMYRPMFYSGNYAIHGSGSIPPFPASHGCARVSVGAMDMIWRDGLLRMGDRVLVV